MERTLSKERQNPSILTGVVVGGLLTAALMSLLYLGEQLAGLPLVPLDIFDWFARVAPGELITFGIDTMVSMISALNLGDTSTVAKTAEIMMGLTIFLVGVGFVGGGVFFAVMARRETVRGYLPGLVMALVVGGPLVIISQYMNYSVRPGATAAPILSFIWLVLLFGSWGVALNWIYNDLFQIKPASAAPAVTETPTPRTQKAEAMTISRRQFLIRVGSATAVVTVGGTGLATILNQGAVQAEPEPVAISVPTATPTPPGDELAAAFEPAPGTRPEYTPLDDHYRIDISTRIPAIDRADWSLEVSGLVENPTNFTLDQLREDFEPVEEFVTLSCISNRVGGDLISTTKWTGIRMSDLLDIVQPQETAGAIKITGADNFFEYVTMDLLRSDDRIMLAYAWDDQLLKQKHGFPLRIWIPDRYGMKQPKWITSIEFVESWDEGYWVRRGWSKEAIVRTTSVIDTVATEDIVWNGDSMLVPVGGIAYAGARSISKVEVRVDGGDWQEARLKDPLADTTWVLWRYDWPFEEGSHTFEVRCVDGEGEPQIEAVMNNRPDGATGIHMRSAFVREPEGTPEPEATSEAL